MRFHPILALSSLCLALCAPLMADAPVHLALTAPQTSLSAALAGLATQTGTTILTDSTVANDQIGPVDFQAANVGALLTKLQTVAPGLTWHKVSLPVSDPLPTGEALSQEVRALEAITATGLVVASPTDVIDYTHHTATAPATVGMQTVYLVTDEAVRAKEAKTAQAPTSADAGSSVDQAASGMKNVANIFGLMTPDQQKAALPLMFQQFQRIMQSMDPAVQAGLAQQFQQMRQNGQGFGNGQ
jgi:hypothetical protein